MPIREEEVNGITIITIEPEPDHFQGHHFYNGESLHPYVSTPGVRDSISQQDVDEALTKFFQGDWGDLADAEDIESNNAAFKIFQRGNPAPLMLGEYHSKEEPGVKDAIKFWIHHSVGTTTVLLPEEY